MKRATKLAGNIVQAGQKARYDAACRQLISNKAILAWILKGCVEEFYGCDIRDIAERYIEGTPEVGTVGVHPDETNEETPAAAGDTITGMNTEDTTLTEGKVTYDVRFYALAPKDREQIRLLLNVEAQGDFYPGYPLVKRGFYYCGRMVSAQYGTEFTGSHYENIRKVYSIWLCMNPPKKQRNCIARYVIRKEDLVGEMREKKENYDLLTVVMVYIGTEEEENYSGILRLLDVLFTTRISAEMKLEILQKEFGIKMEELETEVERMGNLSDLVERRGIEQGIRQGIEQGIQQGTAQANANAVRKLMIRLNLTKDEAMQMLELSEADQEKCRQML